jgi:hypothetical protein
VETGAEVVILFFPPSSSRSGAPVVLEERVCFAPPPLRFPDDLSLLSLYLLTSFFSHVSSSDDLSGPARMLHVRRWSPVVFKLLSAAMASSGRSSNFSMLLSESGDPTRSVSQLGMKASIPTCVYYIVSTPHLVLSTILYSIQPRVHYFCSPRLLPRTISSTHPVFHYNLDRSHVYRSCYRCLAKGFPPRPY